MIDMYKKTIEVLYIALIASGAACTVSINGIITAEIPSQALIGFIILRISVFTGTVTIFCIIYILGLIITDYIDNNNIKFKDNILSIVFGIAFPFIVIIFFINEPIQIIFQLMDNMNEFRSQIACDLSHSWDGGEMAMHYQDKYCPVNPVGVSK